MVLCKTLLFKNKKKNPSTLIDLGFLADTKIWLCEKFSLEVNDLNYNLQIKVSTRPSTMSKICKRPRQQL